jgi:hypothetical protein
MGDEVRGLIGRRLEDGHGVTHLVLVGSRNPSIGGVDVKTTCGLEYNVIPEISLRKRGNVDCMGCLVKAR